MRKILTVAWSEFLTAVQSKAFILGIALLPVLVFGSMAVQKLGSDRADREIRKVAIVDRTGQLYPLLSQAASLWNDRQVKNGAIVGPRFAIEQSGETPSLDAVKLALSDRVRKGELFAFVELPPELMTGKPVVRYYTENSTYEALPRWIEQVVSRLVMAQRLQTSNVDAQTIIALMQRTELTSLGLVERGSDGRLIEAKKVDMVRSFVTPVVLMMLMFVLVISTASPLLNSVMEEKMTRISEVLLGSVTPFQLMMGKLVGIVAVSLLLAVIYLSGAYTLATYNGYGDAVTPMQIVWFIVYLVMAMLIYGSLFIAIGAAATDLKDAQGMMTPVMMLFMIPMFVWLPVLRAPSSTMAVTASLVPLATPILMTLRLALKPGPAAWQIALSFVLTALTTGLLVFAAGRIFRVGILMQGKSATFGEMFRWMRAK
jgi:ABC-2 type transport system permease protein